MILVAVSDRNRAADVGRAIERYNEAWNAHDLDAIVALHAPGMVFENWPDLTFRGRRLYVRDGIVVSEWTATATDGEGRRLEWDGVDLFPFEDGLIARKDVYSSSHAPRVLAG